MDGSFLHHDGLGGLEQIRHVGEPLVSGRSSVGRDDIFYAGARHDQRPIVLK